MDGRPLLQVMKMVMTLLAPAAGQVHFQQLEGSLLVAGNLIAILDLDNPEAVQAVEPYTGSFPEMGPPLVHSANVDQRFKNAFQSAKNILQGDDSCIWHLAVLMCLKLASRQTVNICLRELTDLLLT